MATPKLPQVVRITNERNYKARRLAFHPNEHYGICARAEADSVFLIWNGGYKKYAKEELPLNGWLVPRNEQDRILPMRMRRPWLSVLLNLFVVEIVFERGYLEYERHGRPS